MTWKRARALLLAGCIVGAASATAALGGGTAAQVRGASVQPAITGAIAFRARTAPMPTSGCVATIGIRCYSPGQFERAYDLAPLHRIGLDGAGQTIAIVDSFGSPTIANDLHVFDQTFANPPAGS